MHVSEVLRLRPDPGVAWSTGLPALDQFTGGFGCGQLWVITGAPSSGKTTLLTQFIHRLAVEHHVPVHWHAAGSDSLADIQQRLLALACRRPRPGPNRPAVTEPLTVPQEAGRAALREADLDLHLQGAWHIDRNWGVAESVCLAIDEPEFNRPPVLSREGLDDLRRFADRSNLVLVTAPRSHCVEPAEHGDRLREEWASVADVILEILPTNNLGDASLRLLRNRRGPTGTMPTVHLAHLACFMQSGSH